MAPDCKGVKCKFGKYGKNQGVEISEQTARVENARQSDEKVNDNSLITSTNEVMSSLLSVCQSVSNIAEKMSRFN